MVAKRWNIRLSLALLAALAVIFARQLPPLVAANLTAVVAFGYFVFKAGYAQSELLFYFLFFLTFLASGSSWAAGAARSPAGWRAAAGALAALAHLTKAALLPFVALFVGVYRCLCVDPGRTSRDVVARSARRPCPSSWSWRSWPCFRRISSTASGPSAQYFYNVNTTFYAWYDNWAQASVGTLPAWRRRGMARHAGRSDSVSVEILAVPYLRRRSRRGSAAGSRTWLVRSYRTYGYLKYVAWYLAMLAIVILSNTAVFIASRPPQCRRSPRSSACTAVSHLLLIAFYEPISGTGTTRFLIAHLTPFFYAASRYLAHPEVAGRRVGRSPAFRWACGTCTC